MPKTVLGLGQHEVDGWQMQAIGVVLGEGTDQVFQHGEIISRGGSFCKGHGGVVGQWGIGTPNGIESIEGGLSAAMLLD
jgi:hypothetical protein